MKSLTRAAFASIAFISYSAFAQGAYPEKPIVFIVPQSAGGANDGYYYDRGHVDGYDRGYAGGYDRGYVGANYVYGAPAVTAPVVYPASTYYASAPVYYSTPRVVYRAPVRAYYPSHYRSYYRPYGHDHGYYSGPHHVYHRY